MGPRTDDVSGLRDFRIPRVTCCPSRCLTLIKLLIADLSRRQYRRSSSISLQSHTYRGSIVLRLIDSIRYCVTEINQTRFFYLFEFRDAALHGVYMYGENTIAAICSVIGALWPPLWVPPKLARRTRFESECRDCHKPTTKRRK